jgi:hypothetical protein
MPKVTVAEAAARYGTNAAAQQGFWASSPSRTNVDPTALAAAAGGKAVSAYTAAWTSGRIGRKLAAVGKQGWAAGFTTEAASRYASAVQSKGETKWSAAMQTWFPIFDQLQAQIANMPKNTPQDSINRVAAWINGTIAAKQNQ